MSGSGEGTTPGRAGALRADHPWVTAAVTFAIVLAPFLAWALATPPYASPDENDHIRYAVAVASLTSVKAIPADTTEWSDDVVDQFEQRGLSQPELIAVGWGYARLPAFYSQEGFPCFIFRSDITAECQQIIDLTGTDELVMSTRLYPKPYYAIVGLPSLVADHRGTLYAMRAISGALSAAAVTFAIMVARRRHRPMLLGIAVALTPMVWFMGASVNPNGTEIALALAWWVGLVALLDDRQPRTRALLVGTVVVGAGLAVVRPLSLVWLGLISIVVMINAGLGPLRRLLADRAALVGGAIVLVFCAVQTLLVLGNGSLGSTDPRTALDGIETSAALRTSIGRQPQILEEMIGVFGWLDTRVPAAVVVAWLVVLGIVVALALLTGRRRHLVVLAGLGVAAIAVPVALEVQGVSAVGFIWQGRYSLPLAIGVPLLAARAIDVGHGVAITAPAQRRIALAVSATTAGGAAIAFYQALRRYTVGVMGPVQLWDDIRWQPPLPAWSAVAFGIGAHLLMGWWLYMLITHRPPAATVAGGRDALT